jgi:hypothetical protein
MPNRTHDLNSYDGWAYAAATKEKDYFLVYWEKGCPAGALRGVIPEANYEAKWFNPRKGEWLDVSPAPLKANLDGWIAIPQKPTDDDWGMQLLLRP